MSNPHQKKYQDPPTPNCPEHGEPMGWNNENECWTCPEPCGWEFHI